MPREGGVGKIHGEGEDSVPVLACREFFFLHAGSLR